jgi:ADP-glucose pyrophosphorylase
LVVVAVDRVYRYESHRVANEHSEQSASSTVHEEIAEENNTRDGEEDVMSRAAEEIAVQRRHFADGIENQVIAQIGHYLTRFLTISQTMPTVPSHSLRNHRKEIISVASSSSRETPRIRAESYVASYAARRKRIYP